MISSPFRKWLIVVAVMLVTVIEVLDTTIVNVALTPMMGALGATRDQITWVLTSYIVSSAIVMPLTGYLVNIMGRKKLLLTNIIGFMCVSVCCGLAANLSQIVFFRMLQGIFGASLIPLSQYVLMDTFSHAERGKAMAIWGIGIMVGPILGPTLGGFITESLSWRWIFFINFPVCFVAFLLAMEVIQDTPRQKIKTDWPGLCWLVLWVGALQILLDRGQTDDWFESNTMVFLFCVFAVSVVIFIVRGLNHPNHVVNLRVFADKNYSQSCVLIMLAVSCFFSLIALQPLMTQQLMNYPPDVAGLLMAPRGLTSAFAMLLVARFISKYDPRLFVVVGLFISAVTSFWMSHFNLQTSFAVMAAVTCVQGLGVGLFFVPLSTMAFSTLKSEDQAEASGLFSFSRNLGTSLGISLVNTYVTRLSQKNWNELSGYFSPSNPNFQHWLQHQNLQMNDPQTLAYFSQELARQSSMIAFVNTYWLIGMCFLCMLPLVLFLKKPSVVKTSLLAE